MTRHVCVNTLAKSALACEVRGIDSGSAKPSLYLMRIKISTLCIDNRYPLLKSLVSNLEVKGSIPSVHTFRSVFGKDVGCLETLAHTGNPKTRPCRGQPGPTFDPWKVVTSVGDGPRPDPKDKGTRASLQGHLLAETRLL